MAAGPVAGLQAMTAAQSLGWGARWGQQGWDVSHPSFSGAAGGEGGAASAGAAEGNRASP